MAENRKYTDNIWSGSFKYATTTVPFTKKKEKDDLSSFLAPVDESPEFYDPYSDLNLFLSRKIKQQMQHCGCSKKWSVKVQEELIASISPDFQKQFPRYRLGVSALKKTWEKVAHFSQQIEGQKEAVAQDGKLNIPYFIRENLKNFKELKGAAHFHPSHYAQQVASKMGECIALNDGIRPQTDHLAKMIWSIQRHLLTGGGPERYASPYDDYDKIDKLIVKTILEISAKEPQVCHELLEQKVKEALHDVPSFASEERMQWSIAALLAEKLYAASPFHAFFFVEQKTALDNFIRRHTALCKTSGPSLELNESVRRIAALYTLATNLPKSIPEALVREAIACCYPHALARPDLPQPLYAFIAAELVLMKNEQLCRSPSYVQDAIWSAYQETAHLPVMGGDFLEIAIWKSLSETEGLLEKLPYRIGHRIEEEIGNTLIDNPTQSFSSVVYETAQSFKRVKELVQVKSWEEIEKKIQNWAVQGDMLCKWIRLDHESTLLRLIKQKWNDRPSMLPHHLFVSEICQEYLRSYPELAPYTGQLAVRVWILYKYAWYTLFSSQEESSYDRFLKWHSSRLLYSGPNLDHAHLVHQLEEIVAKTSPLIPFDRKQADALLS